ncbi:hypothetical protein DSCW_23590 [Desulfosarcina widdelii]|uniref:Uncharacterized protein n=1 Tax=Desulfosarcina widdelii TaxID=947919 RepID=A0A5K7YZ10_9BACT|nr:hypothetical protein DSCW_23590 [Desulfosarcina widdelii]
MFIPNYFYPNDECTRTKSDKSLHRILSVVPESMVRKGKTSKCLIYPVRVIKKLWTHCGGGALGSG